MTVLHRILTLAQNRGVPLGRWPDPASLTFHLRRLLAQYEVDLVIDVGAHRGEYATLLRREVRYTGDLVSFEPAAEAFDTLAQRAEGDARWRVVQLALGEAAGVANLQIYRNTMLNSLRPPSQFGVDVWKLSVATTEDVPVARLDEIELSLARYSAPFLKIDTQGFDLDVLRGARNILDQVVAIQFEVPMLPLYEGATAFHGMIAEVERLGFAVSGLFPVAHDPKLRAVEFDCVAVRAG